MASWPTLRTDHQMCSGYLLKIWFLSGIVPVWGWHAFSRVALNVGCRYSNEATGTAQAGLHLVIEIRYEASLRELE